MFAQEKYKQKLERDYEKKVIDILEPFIGLDRVVAKVSVVLDFTKQEIQQEIYEPEGTIRSQQTTELTTSKEEKGASEAGAPGAQSNIQNPDDGNDGDTKAKSSSEEAKNVINYEISKKIIKQNNNAFALLQRVTTAVTFDSTVLEKLDNKDEFLKNISSIVEETVGYKSNRGDKVTVKAFKFIGFGGLDNNSSEGAAGAIAEDNTLLPMLVKSIMQDFGEYIQYLIASILLFIFYKKFIANNEIVLAGGISSTGSAGEGNTSGASSVADMDMDFEATSFNQNVAKNRLKAKVKSQILNNIDGLDEESAAKYEILIEELDREVQNNPEDIASMIEMLLFEGDSKFRS